MADEDDGLALRVDDAPGRRDVALERQRGFCTMLTL
jgi:hypothetical protein